MLSLTFLENKGGSAARSHRETFQSIRLESSRSRKRIVRFSLSRVTRENIQREIIFRRK